MVLEYKKKIKHQVLKHNHQVAVAVEDHLVVEDRLAVEGHLAVEDRLAVEDHMVAVHLRQVAELQPLLQIKLK